MFKIDLQRSRWQSAIDAWRDGDSSRLSTLLRSAYPLPDFVRDFLANVVDGSAKKNRGRKKQVHPLRDAIIELEFERAHEMQKLLHEVLKAYGDKPKGTPKDNAIEILAKRFNLSADTISGIVYPRKRAQKKQGDK